MPRPRKALFTAFANFSQKCTAFSNTVLTRAIPALRDCGRDEVVEVLNRERAEIQVAIAQFHAEVARLSRGRQA